MCWGEDYHLNKTKIIIILLHNLKNLESVSLELYFKSEIIGRDIQFLGRFLESRKKITHFSLGLEYRNWDNYKSIYE